MAMRVPSTDYEWGRAPAGVTEKEFDRRKNLLEGINGCDRMNTHFENTERNQVLAPRGDARFQNWLCSWRLKKLQFLNRQWQRFGHPSPDWPSLL